MTRLDRRQFLLRSSALLLGTRLYNRSYFEGEPVRIAVVGTGGRGTDLIRKLSTIEGAKIVAVCDDYEPHLKRGAEATGSQAEAFADYDLMLRQTTPQAVVIATPLYLHYEMSMAALDAGCDVFCEKTMCYSIDQARQLVEAVEERGTVFQVGLQRRANAVYEQAASMVASGMLGQITSIKCQWHRNNDWRRPVPVGRDHPDWQKLEHRLNWRLYHDYSRGLMTELASHQLDVANRLLGTTPKRVMATGGIDYWRDGREVFDNIYCIYDYELPPAQPGERPYTVRVTYSSIQSNAFEGASELIMGTKGTLMLTQTKGLFYQEKGIEDIDWGEEGRAERDATVVTSGKTLKLSNDPWAHRGIPYEMDPNGDDTRDQLVAFLDNVQRRDPATICDVRVGLEDTATALIGHQALHQEGPVEYPSDLG